MAQKKNNQMNKDPKKLTHKKVSLYSAIFFFVFIIIADIFLIFDHGKAFSENENRVLTQAPVLSMRNISSRKFMNDLEGFISDQFFMRDNWIGVKLKSDKLIGKKESHDVYLGKKGYLFENTTAPDAEALAASIEAINSFAAENSKLNIVMTVVPNATEIYKELTPPGAPLRDQTKDIEETASALGTDVTFVDVKEALVSHKEEQLFYKSDHHWTTAGARYAFEALAPALEIERPASSYKIMQVTDDFSGTMASSSGDFNVADSIEIYVPENNIDYYVEFSDDTAKYPTIYNSEALSRKNKYEVFTGGNHPMIKITTTNDNGKSLMVIKDSYANCFLPFLIPYYEQIVVVDPRYYSDDLKAEIKNSRITDVLILYNENTFVADTSLAGVLSE